MKKTFFKALLSVFASMLFSCKKKLPVNIPSDHDILVDHKWKLNTWISEPAFMNTIDMYANLAPCQKDDIQSYQKNGVIIVDRGPLRCFSGDGQIDTSTKWNLNGKQLITRLFISNSLVKTDTSEIIILNDKRLEYVSKTKMNNKIYKFTYGYGVE